MKGSVLIVLFSLASVWADFESVSFRFYDELKNSVNEQCRIDVNKTLEAVKNLDKWALECLYLFGLIITFIINYCYKLFIF